MHGVRRVGGGNRPGDDELRAALRRNLPGPGPEVSPEDDFDDIVFSGGTHYAVDDGQLPPRRRDLRELDRRGKESARADGGVSRLARRVPMAWRWSAPAAFILLVIAGFLFARAAFGGGADEITIDPVAQRDSTARSASAEAQRGEGPALPTPGEGAPDPPGTLGGPLSAASGPAKAGQSVVVHVVGAVNRPGVVSLPVGSRVADAIKAAGEALPGAQLDALNLAAPVTDGSQVRVLGQGELPPPESASPSNTESSESGAGSVGSGGGSADAGSGAPSAKVNVNTASETELTSLPRVGPVLAERIVAWRNDHGPFSSVDDLDAVPGVGPKMLESLRELVEL